MAAEAAPVTAAVLETIVAATVIGLADLDAGLDSEMRDWHQYPEAAGSRGKVLPVPVIARSRRDHRRDQFSSGLKWFFEPAYTVPCL